MKNILKKLLSRIHTKYHHRITLPIRSICAAVSIPLICFTACNGKEEKKNSEQSLEKAFISAADSIRTAVYWYWISDNISEEGVIKDLQAMKKAGINRAFIGNIGENLPYGKVKMFSSEWWQILHTALKTATELDIEIGIFNSPGWSQSGGPWVKPEEAMRYLAASETRITGPRKLNIRLEKPTELFEDVKVIAYPAPEEDATYFNSTTGKINLSNGGNAAALVDNNPATWITLPQEKKLTITFNADNPFTARSLTIRPAARSIDAEAVLTAKIEGRDSLLSRFSINRTNSMLSVGFEPYAPVVISLPPTQSETFTLSITSKNENSALTEIELSSAALLGRYPEKTFAKMHQTPLPYWGDYMWPEEPEIDKTGLAIPPRKVIDLSSYMDNKGVLTYDLPEGKWVIMRMGMTPTGTTNAPASPESTGYEIDKMSKKHVEKHFYAYMGEILKRIPEADRKCLKVVVQDSYETGGQNFTDDMLEEFKARYGYDPVPFLPVYRGYVVENRKTSDRFLWDMRRMVADKVAYDYVGGLREVCHKHGLITWLENYGHWGFPSEFLMYGGQSDEIGGEFWSDGDLGNIENRAASSCGHIYGKNKIWAESNTYSGQPYSRYPATLKQRCDRFFSEGINATLLHVFISQPYDSFPGVNAWFGNEFDHHNTWFSQLDSYTDYLKRTNLMLQQGLNVADVAYFIGEDAPKMTGVTDPALPLGYQFDYMNAEVIERDMTVKNGLLTLPHGTQYKLLVLPKQKTMRPELLAKIKQLVENGAAVLGPAPLYSPSLQNQPEADTQVASMASELWGEVNGSNVKYRKVGKGLIMDGLSMPEALALIECEPDCRLPQNAPILYGHRTAPQLDIYYITNQSDRTQTVTPGFRITGRQPELWNPVTGNIRKLPAFKQTAGMTEVPLLLAPYESIFVVFRTKAENSASEADIKINYPDPVLITHLNGPWKVQFDPAMRGPEETVIMPELQLWNESNDERIKYYSGTAFYTTDFTLDTANIKGNIILDIGEVRSMAKIKINGERVGGVWTAPYHLDITAWIRQGKNEIEIEVVNTWVNRLIGDSRLPVAERKTWCFHNPWKPDSPLQPSGLVGPVRLYSVAAAK